MTYFLRLSKANISNKVQYGKVIASTVSNLRFMTRELVRITKEQYRAEVGWPNQEMFATSHMMHVNCCVVGLQIIRDNFAWTIKLTIF